MAQHIQLEQISPTRKHQKAHRSEVDLEVAKRKFAILPDESMREGAASEYDHSARRAVADDLGVMEGEMDEEGEDRGQVEMDLLRGIMRMARSEKWAAVSGLVGACLLHLIVGAIYRWNMIAEYVGAHFDEYVWTPVGAPLSMLCAGVTMRLGYNLSNSYGSRLVLTLALGLAIMGNFAGAFSKTFPGFLFWHNGLFGLSAGLLFLPPLKQCHKFFPRMKLVTNSIILTGTGLGTVLFGAYNMECIEGEYETRDISKEQFAELVRQNFSMCLLEMTGLMVVIGLLGLAMMIPLILRNEEQDRIERDQSVEERGNFCKSECEAFSSRVFWVLAFIIFLTSSGSFYVIMNFKNLLQKQHREKLFLYTIVLSGALGNGITRLFWGFASSRIGFKTLLSVAAALSLISFIIIMVTEDKHLYLAFYTVNSVSLGGLMVIFPNVSLLVFGKRIGESIYSYYWIAFSLGNFFQFLITLVLTNEPTTSQDYSEVLIFFILCLGASLVLIYRQTLQGPWKNSLDLVAFTRLKKRKQST